MNGEIKSIPIRFESVLAELDLDLKMYRHGFEADGVTRKEGHCEAYFQHYLASAAWDLRLILGE